MGIISFFSPKPQVPLEDRLWWAAKRYYFGHYREEFKLLTRRLARALDRQVRCTPDVPGRCAVLEDRLVGTIARISIRPVSGEEPPVIVSVATRLPPSFDIWFQTAFLFHQVKITKLEPPHPSLPIIV